MVGEGVFCNCRGRILQYVNDKHIVAVKLAGKFPVSCGGGQFSCREVRKHELETMKSARTQICFATISILAHLTTKSNETARPLMTGYTLHS